MTGLGIVLLVAAGVAAVIGLEITNAPRDTIEPLSSHTATLPTSVTATVTDRSGEWEATILGRPLFSPDRRPSATATAMAGHPGLPRLTGIMVGPFGRSAIFAADGAKPIVVPEGARVAEYTVKVIEPTQVRLSGPNGNLVLYPSFTAASANRVTKAPLPR